MSDPIVTLTLNPAIDMSAVVRSVTPDHKLRCRQTRHEPGGGGINVARVCHRLGAGGRAVVPIGGANGQRLAALLADEGIEVATVPVEGETRQSLSISEETTGRQFRFVLPGPTLTAAEIDVCRAVTIEALGPTSCLVISGSLPDGVDPEILSDLVRAAPDNRVLIDTSGPALAEALASGAYLVKPSARELAAVVGRELTTEADILDAAVELQQRHPVQVLVASIGAGGAIVVDESGPWRVRAPTVRVRSTVGAGDSMVAGLAIGLGRGLPLKEAAALGVAAGTAAVLTDGTELCRSVDVDRLLGSVVVEPDR